MKLQNSWYLHNAQALHIVFSCCSLISILFSWIADYGLKVVERKSQAENPQLHFIFIFISLGFKVFITITNLAHWFMIYFFNVITFLVPFAFLSLGYI